MELLKRIFLLPIFVMMGLEYVVFNSLIEEAKEMKKRMGADWSAEMHAEVAKGLSWNEAHPIVSARFAGRIAEVSKAYNRAFPFTGAIEAIVS